MTNGMDFAQLFNEAHGHLPIALRRLDRARLLWLNQREMQLDPNFDASLGQTAYEQHLLNACAVQIDSMHESAPIEGIADRYGGRGIGSNGGAGRAGFVNGYYLKGIGRTPLVGAGADPVHSTGAMELAECMREVVFSEIVAQEFPCGAVPVLAIIDTGLTRRKVLEAGIGHAGNDFPGAQDSPMCILVRPMFLRPAHFDRAPLFQTDQLFAGRSDAQRVRQMILGVRSQAGQLACRQAFEALWQRWAVQFAYAWIARLPQGGCSPSNITWDGKLLDFGAMSAIPSWAKISTVHNAPLIGMELPMLMDCLKAIALQWGRFDADLSYSPEQLTALRSQTIHTFHHEQFVQMLRLLGLSRMQSIAVLGSQYGVNIQQELNRILAHHGSEYFETFECTPEPRIAWEFENFWSKNLSGAFERLRSGLLNLLCPEQIEKEQREMTLRILKTNNQQRAKTRISAYRENIRHAIESVLKQADASKLRTEIDCALDRLIVEGRRDSKNEVQAASLIGFERKHCLNYSRFQCERTQREFLLLDEPQAAGLRENRARIEV